MFVCGRGTLNDFEENYNDQVKVYGFIEAHHPKLYDNYTTYVTMTSWSSYEICRIMQQDYEIYNKQKPYQSILIS